MTNRRSSGAFPPRARRGMTLIEVILAVVILSGAMLGLANFGRQFQHNTSNAAMQALGSDLATQRLETIKSHMVYSTLVATFHGASETFGSDPVYRGFTRATAATRTGPDGVNDYITVTVTVTGNQLPTPIMKNTIIAAF